MKPAMIAVTVLVLAGCDDAPPPPRHRAVATLIRNGLDADDRAGWKTELEILRSQAMLDRVVRELTARGVTAPVEALRRGISARQRADSRVIEISVALDDRELARSVCGVVVEQYQAQQLDAGSAEIAKLERELEAQRTTLMVDGHEDPARLAAYGRARERLYELELSVPSRVLTNGVMVLDPVRDGAVIPAPVYNGGMRVVPVNRR